MNSAERASVAESADGSSQLARAAWWIAGVSTLAICAQTLLVLTEDYAPSIGSRSAIEVVWIVGVWIAPALVVMLFGRSSAAGWWQIVCALLTGAMAISMVFGDPSMAEGGVWFGYALFFVFVPLAVVATLILFGGAIVAFVRSLVRAGSG